MVHVKSPFIMTGKVLLEENRNTKYITVTGHGSPLFKRDTSTFSR